ncbi:MAG: hypothetical protein U0414_39825 [Polyangiaceae bacterium]
MQSLPSTRVLGLLVLFSATAACSSKSSTSSSSSIKSSAPAPAKPLKLTSREAPLHSYISCEEERGGTSPCYMSLDAGDPKEHGGTRPTTVSFSRAPDLIFEVGGTKFDPMKESSSIPFDITPYVVDSKGDEGTFRIPVKITLGGREATSELTYNDHHAEAVAAQLRKVASGPVKLPGDDTAKPVKGALLLFAKDVELIGEKPTKSNAEIDILGVVENVKDQKGSCGMYSNDKTGREITSHRFDREVKVYERRTGKELGKQVFVAPPVVCPSTTTIAEYTVSTYGDPEQMKAFVQKFIR